MMKQQVVISRIKITRAGQVVFFQLRLPKDTAHIIGIQTGIIISRQAFYYDGYWEEWVQFVEPCEDVIYPFRWTSFQRNELFGELKLQSAEEANIFYATHIHSDENLGMGDYSSTCQFPATVFTHQNKKEEDSVKVDGESTIVQGFYKDIIGEYSEWHYEYWVSIYVWVAIN